MFAVEESRLKGTRLSSNSSQIIMLRYPSRDFTLSASPHLSLLTPLHSYINPLNPMCDQDRISPYNINTTSTR